MFARQAAAHAPVGLPPARLPVVRSSSPRGSAGAAGPRGSRCGGRGLHGDGILGPRRGRPLPGATATATIIGRAVRSGHDAAAGCSVYWWRLDAAVTAAAPASSLLPGPGPVAEPDAAADLSATDRVLPRSAWSQVMVTIIVVVVRAVSGTAGGGSAFSEAETPRGRGRRRETSFLARRSAF